ncbi:PVC-type heme-binding CxxCH protein [Verrucomicrobiota bacterium sgz303538]
MQSTGFPWTGVLSGAFLLSLSSAHAAEFTVGAHTFTLPDGYTIECVAAPPLVDRPISADFDEQGRLYVTDSSGSNDKAEKQLEEKPHRIVRLEDTDGDGKFDRSTVFADHMMFPEGAMWLDGSLYVAAPPSIWKLTDTDGDGVADQREEWYKGGTLTGCANDLHGPYLGPDGWIYWCKGAFAEQTHERDGRPPMKDRAAHIFRCRRDGSRLESVMSGGMDNPIEVAFTAEGEPIFTSTFLDLSGPGKRDGLGHAVLGGVFPKINDVTDDVTRTGPLLPAMTHFGPGAPSGLCRYRSDLLGGDFRDNLFATLFNLHKVTRHVLEQNGATFRTRDSDFVVSNNSDFHPTDVLEDADGSLLVIDTGGWYKLCCPTSQLAKPDVLGAIYRIRRVGAPAIKDPRGAKLDWATMEADPLVQLLADSRPVVVQRAVERLVRMAPGAVPALRKLCNGPGPSAPIKQALWALARIGSKEACIAMGETFLHKDPLIQQTAALAAGSARNSSAVQSLGMLVEHAAGTGAPHVRRAAAEALARIREPRAVPALLEASGTAGDDPFLEHAITFALIETGDASATSAGLATNKPSATRRAALIALNEMDGRHLQPEQIAELLNSSDDKLREAALWTLGRRHDVGPVLAKFLPTQLSTPNLSAPVAAQVEEMLVHAVQVPEVQTLIGQVLRNGEFQARGVALRAMSKIKPRDVPDAWLAGLVNLLENPKPELLGDSISAARALLSKKESPAQLIPPLLRLATTESLSPEARLDALAAVPSVPCASEERLFTFLCSQLQKAPSVPTRTLAATVIARAKLGDAQRENLAELLSQLGPAELTKLLPAYATSLPETLARRVIAALEQSPGLSALQPQTFGGVLAKFPTAVQPDGERLLARLNVDLAQQRTRLEVIAAELPKGDVRRGQTVFNSAKAACSVCHAMGYLGGKLGPDLTSIGTVRSERDLLESIVFPSASFVRSYEPATVRLKSGEEIMGILRSEASDSVTLALAAGTEQRIARSEVAEVQPGTISLMPQGFDQILTRQELADLLAFLKATKWGAK